MIQELSGKRAMNFKKTSVVFTILVLWIAFFSLQAFAEETRTPINTLTATINKEPSYGATIETPVFSNISALQVNFNSPSWQKKNSSSGWVSATGIFTEGTYRYKAQLRIDSPYGTTHYLKEPLNVTISSKTLLREDGSPLIVDTTYSYVYLFSPEYIVSNTPGTPLSFGDSSAYDIPASIIGTAITNIDVSSSATGGTAPYSFSATGLPDGIVISNAGVISGTPTTANTGGTATITVSDGATPSATKSITISYGAISSMSITYAVTVKDGTGGGNYAKDAIVTIKANTPPSDHQFKNWIVNSGGVTLVDANSGTTTFIMPASAVTVTATYKKISSPSIGGSSGGGGGGSSLKSDSCPKGDFSPSYYDSLCEPPKKEEKKNETSFPISLESVTTGVSTTLQQLISAFALEYKNEPAKIEELAKALASVQSSTRNQEFKDAYTYAYLRGIITQTSIEKADLDHGLTRSEMAKIMAVYATKVLDKKVLNSDVPIYGDTKEVHGDLAEYIVLVYQLGIMGINAQGKALPNFNPNGAVSRAEFATVLSRVLFGDTYNMDGADFAIKHLEALQKAGVIKDTTPTNKELKGWVMLMLQRAEGVK